MSARPTVPARRGTPASALALSLAGAFGVGAVFARAGDARAQSRSSANAVGRAALLRGTAAYDVGDYEAALRAFQDAYIAVRDPTILLNVGAAFERLGRSEEARRALRQYLDRIPNAPDRRLVEARIAALDAAVETAAGSMIAPLRVRPTGAPRVGAVEGASGDEPLAAPRAPWWPWVLVGVGGAAAIGGGALLATVPDPWNAGAVRSEDEYANNERAALTHRVAGIALVAGGSALAVAGVVLGALLRPRAERRVSVLPAGWYAEGAALAGVSVRAF